MFKPSWREIMLLQDLYANPMRYYHIFGHAISVARASDELCKSNILWPENVLKAALWHDAVYVFGASNNEELSAQALLNFDASQTEAADLIRLTTIDEHLSDRITFVSNPKASILLDADLVSLSFEYPDFIVQQKLIGMESGVGFNIVKGHVDFLHNFLNKERIFRCPNQERRETRARMNIEQLIKEFE